MNNKKKIIISESNKNAGGYWYSNLNGNSFLVEQETPGSYGVFYKGEIRYINKSDTVPATHMNENKNYKKYNLKLEQLVGEDSITINTDNVTDQKRRFTSVNVGDKYFVFDTRNKVFPNGTQSFTQEQIQKKLEQLNNKI